MSAEPSNDISKLTKIQKLAILLIILVCSFKFDQNRSVYLLSTSREMQMICQKVCKFLLQFGEKDAKKCL